MTTTTIRLPLVTVTDPALWGQAVQRAYDAVHAIVVNSDNVMTVEFQGGEANEWRAYGYTEDEALTVYVPLVQSYPVTTEDDADEVENPIHKGRHAATYHGITYAKCLTCGAESRDASELELWNDYGVACLENDCRGASEWHLTDGTVNVVPSDEEAGGSRGKTVGFTDAEIRQYN